VVKQPSRRSARQRERGTHTRLLAAPAEAASRAAREKPGCTAGFCAATRAVQPPLHSRCEADASVVDRELNGVIWTAAVAVDQARIPGLIAFVGEAGQAGARVAPASTLVEAHVGQEALVLGISTRHRTTSGSATGRRIDAASAARRRIDIAATGARPASGRRWRRSPTRTRCGREIEAPEPTLATEELAVRIVVGADRARSAGKQSARQEWQDRTNVPHVSQWPNSSTRIAKSPPR
jgi:hypothetical protein